MLDEREMGQLDSGYDRRQVDIYSTLACHLFDALIGRCRSFVRGEMNSFISISIS